MKKKDYKTKKFKAGQGMVRDLTTLAPNTKPGFIGYDFVNGEYVRNDTKVNEIIINRNNKSFYEQMVREGSLIEVGK